MPYYFLNGLDSSDDTHSATNLLFHADHDSSSFIFSIQIFFSQSTAQSKITGVQPVCWVKDPWNHFNRHPSIPYHTTPHHKSVQKSNSLSPAVTQWPTSDNPGNAFNRAQGPVHQSPFQTIPVHLLWGCSYSNNPPPCLYCNSTLSTLLKLTLCQVWITLHSHKNLLASGHTRVRSQVDRPTN